MCIYYLMYTSFFILIKQEHWLDRLVLFNKCLTFYNFMYHFTSYYLTFMRWKKKKRKKKKIGQTYRPKKIGIIYQPSAALISKYRQEKNPYRSTSTQQPRAGGRAAVFNHQQEQEICNIVIANNSIRLREIQSAIINDNNVFANIKPPAFRFLSDLENRTGPTPDSHIQGLYGHEKPEKSWNFKTAISRPGKFRTNM